jgi:uncharacterized membrane protein YdfJ with MMPL/SSD domain
MADLLYVSEAQNRITTRFMNFFAKRPELALLVGAGLLGLRALPALCARTVPVGADADAMLYQCVNIAVVAVAVWTIAPIYGETNKSRVVLGPPGGPVGDGAKK